jgi:hypothetical protein
VSHGRRRVIVHTASGGWRPHGRMEIEGIRQPLVMLLSPLYTLVSTSR